MEARLLRQTPSTLRAAIAPKLAAAQNLGGACAHAALGFTLSFSSVSSLAGFSGHANYCAANAAVDAHAAHAAAQGLPSLAVQWSAWSAVGDRSSPGPPANSPAKSTSCRARWRSSLCSCPLALSSKFTCLRAWEG